jgi:porin
VVLILGAAAPAWAQGTGVLPGGPGAQPAQEVNQPPEPEAPPPFRQSPLFGDLAGLRTKLANQGVDLELGYLAEFGANATGERTGPGYAGQVTFSADVNWEKLATIPGFNTHFVVVNRHGSNVSRTFGDHLTQANEVYGAGFGTGIKFVYLYGEERLFDDRLSIAVGRLPVAVDFAVSPLYCIPVGLLGCGNPRALTNKAQFTSWPQSTWGGRIRVRPTAETYVQFGAYESDPFPGGGRSGWTWSTVNATGAILPAEVGWEPVFGPEKLIGHYKIGLAYDTSNFNSLDRNRSGGPLLLFTETPALTSGRTQFWVTADQMIIREGPASDAGLTLLGTYANNTASNSVTWQTAFVGALDKGFWALRPDDAIMLSGAWWRISNKLASLQQQQADLGLPLANGALHPQHNEYALELDYIALISRGVYIEPALQYFLHPNADSQLKNAFVFAGRLSVTF